MTFAEHLETDDRFSDSVSPSKKGDRTFTSAESMSPWMDIDDCDSENSLRTLQIMFVVKRILDQLRSTANRFTALANLPGNPSFHQKPAESKRSKRPGRPGLRRVCLGGQV